MTEPSRGKKRSSKKSPKCPGCPENDWKGVNASIHIDPERFVKILLNAPPQSIKKR